MKCPYCEHAHSQVIDSRLTGDGITIRRRRQCLSCSERFTTYETTEDQLLPVLIRKATGHGATVIKFKATLSFLSHTLKLLSRETRQLIGRVKKYEKAQAVGTNKDRAPSSQVSANHAPAQQSGGRIQTDPTAAVLKIIRRHKKGVGISTLKDKTGFDDKKIRNIVYRAYKQGKIKRAGRGVYVKP